MPLENPSATPPPNAPEPDRKYFTVAEANRALPYIRRVTRDIAEAYGRVVELRRRMEQAREEEDSLEGEYDQAMDRLSGLVDELQAAGVELKDFEKGLIDFPAIHEKRQILLCWKWGEERVAYWHEVDGGYAGRQSVEVFQ